MDKTELQIRILRGEKIEAAPEPQAPPPAPPQRNAGGLPHAVAQWKTKQEAEELAALALATTPSPEFDAAAAPKE